MSDLRIVRGKIPASGAIPVGHLECQGRNHVGDRVLPVAKFYRQRVIRKTCNTCAFKVRVARNRKRQAAEAPARAEANRFWDEQATKYA